MQHITHPKQPSVAATSSATTQLLLRCGLIAGPLYILVGGLEAWLRPGFDLRRHALSMLSNGEWGWIHIALFISCGLLTIAGALGLRNAMRVQWNNTAAAWLLGLYGLSLIGAGIFRADPGLGFPPGAPMEATISTGGLLHFAAGGIGFIALIAACFVCTRQFAKRGEVAWVISSALTGVLFGAAFYGIATSAQHSEAVRTIVILAFTGAVMLGWAWISALCLYWLNTTYGRN